MPPTKTLLCAAVATSLTVVGLTVALAPQAQAGTVCDSMTTPVFHRYNPTTKVSILTTSATEAATAARGGYTVNQGTPFKAAKVASTGLYGAQLLTKASPRDRAYMPNPKEAANAVSKYGYSAKGVAFFVPTDAKACTIPINRYRKQAQHTYATTAKQNADLAAAGWIKEGPTFYGAPSTSTPPTTPPTTPPSAPVDTKFSIAVYPDTQQEVGTDSRFIDRSKYLVANKAALDLRFVNHIGDVVNWDTPAHEQYAVAQKAMAPLETAKIPYSMSIGNHDTQATGVGGGARDSRYTRAYQRDTSTFNKYFTTAREGAVAGQFEPGKVDNTYSTFNAGGKKWLVLNLELWPRLAAVDWAKNVVATHPTHNVIVSSHNLMSSDGGISGCASATRCQYGDASPQYVYDNLILAYPNVRMSLSGHVGKAAQRTDTGKAGNKVVSYLQCFHSNDDNPVRLVEIDTLLNTFNSKVIGPKTGRTYVAPSTVSVSLVS